MYRIKTQSIFSLFVIAGMLLSAFGPVAVAAAPVEAPAEEVQAQQAEQEQDPLTPVVSAAVYPADTSGLSPAPTVSQFLEGKEESPEIPSGLTLPKMSRSEALVGESSDPLIQDSVGALNMPDPIVNFEGVNNIDGVLPPDTDGDVGPNHYVQMVNLSTAIYDKSGGLLYGPFHPSDLWPTGDPCRVSNDGDPVALYDQFADRWLLTQFALPNYPNGPFYQCIAVSKTGNPTNVPADWYPYTFLVSSTKMNDYPKLSVWPDAYYMTANQFNAGTLSWGGAGVWAFKRDAMLTGSGTTVVYFDLFSADSNFGGMLPVDVDGMTPPPVGTPGYFFEVDDSTWIPPNDALRLWEFHVDWVVPTNSTFGISGQPNAIMTTAPWDPSPCSGRSCVPQPGTTVRVDDIGDRLMFRAAYRNFGSHESVVLNHSVSLDTSGRLGIRWYEVRDPGGTPVIYQQGTYGPSDGEWRWMGSIAMDHVGNIALGYSVSSSTTYPSIRYVGRLVTDPLGTMPQAEAEIIAGSGSQTHSASRWGDYSAMAVDSVDDCTFWYTQEYIQTTGSAPWQTRVASFKFPNCSIGPMGTLAGTVTDSGTSIGIEGAAIHATATITKTGATTTGPDGSYQVGLQVGSYEVTASGYGYLPQTVTGVEIFENATTTLDFALDPAPSYTVSGYVTDGNTGWPLYAQIDIDGYPGDPIWTDPATGYYEISLVAGTDYTFNASAFSDGYLPTSINIGTLSGNLAVDIQLGINRDMCVAPGYFLDVVGVYETFDDTTIPPGWTTVNNGGACTWTFNDPGGRGNLSGGDGNFAVADSDACGSGTTMNTDLFSPLMDISSLSNLNLEFKYDYNNLSSSEIAAVDVSADGGATWTNLVTWNTDQRGPATFSQDVTSELSGSTQAQIRFRYVAPGWDWWWEVDEVFLGEKNCLPLPGGLLVGNVYDLNTNVGLTGATVESGFGGSTTTVDTPFDPAQSEGFYTLFSPAGAQDLTASVNDYRPETVNVTVVQSDTVQQDFYLGSGLLTYSPDSIDVTVLAGTSATVPMVISNTGVLTASFELQELEGGAVPFGPFEQPGMVVRSFRQDFPPSAVGLGLIQPEPSEPYAAGDIIQSWVPAGVPGPWGIAFDGGNNSVWISSPASAWGGNNTIYEFTPDGTATGRSYPYSWNPANGPADATYNWNTGMLWVMNIATGASNCIYEIDPASGPTGNTICPGGGTGFSISQRGLAYDPTTDTYFAGGWNDLMVYRFASDGTIINSVNTGIAIAGLAYNPETGHLFAVDSAVASRFYVLDANNNYAQIGTFSVSGYTGGAGLEISCDGSMWAVDQDDETVFQFDSGETASLCGGQDVPWLSTIPITGTIPSGGVRLVDVVLDGTSIQPGVYDAQLKLENDTPYTVPNMPINFTVAVPTDWGRITGSVSTPGYCDSDPAFIEGAPVHIESHTGEIWDLATDAGGMYSIWMPAANSPLTVTVDMPDYEFGQATGVMLYGQQITTRDFDLRWMQPCVTASPGSMTVNLNLGQSTSRLLRLNNDGALTTPFTMTEQSLGGPSIPIPALEPDATRRIELSLSNAPASPDAVAEPYAPDADILLSVDDGTAEDSIGLTAGGQFLWLNRFTPDPADFPFVIDEISLLMNNATAVGANLELVIWEDTDGDGDPATNANFLYAENVTVQYNNMTTWNVYTLATPVGISGPGDVLVGVVNRSGASGLLDYPAAIDQGATQRRSWVGLYTANPPEPPTLPPDSDFGIIDDFGLPGNWTLRASGYTGTGASQDVAWLSENPITGTLLADSIQYVTVGFDANAVPLPGEYRANVKTNSLDPINPVANTLVTMNVTAPANWGVLQGTIYTMGYCDINTVELGGASIELESSTGVIRSVTSSGDGSYELWLDSYANPYTMTVSAVGHVPVTIGGVTVGSVGAITIQDADLRSVEPCVTYSPDSISVEVAWGEITTRTVTLTNTGAGSTVFTVTEQAGGFTPMALDFGGQLFVPMAPTLGEDFLVVSEDTAAATSIETALANLGYTYLRATASAFYGTPLADLLTYKAIIYVGPPSTGSEQNAVIAYLDAGGRFLLADDGFAAFYAQGGSISNSLLGATYLQLAIASTTGSTGIINGTDIMSGLSLNISSDTSADSVTANGGDVVNIFDAPDGNWAGTRIDINGYKAIFFGWDFDHIGAAGAAEPEETETLERAIVWLLDLGGVPWLDEAPLTGSIVENGGVQVFDVVFDSSVPEIEQPGTYEATVKIETEDGVNDQINIPVSMLVNPPASWGKLNGTVSGLGYCDVNPAVLSGAAVTIEDSVGGSIGLETDSDGYYQYWVESANGPYTVTAAADGHVTTIASDITVVGEMTSTVDIDLRWDQPCVAFDPASMSVDLMMGFSTTLPMTVTNTGAAATPFRIGEQAGDFIPVTPEPSLAGGPDAFGYTFLDNTEPGGPTYTWIDATGGTALGLSDDGEGNITLPFDFPYYGETSTAMRVGNNGGVIFNATTGDVSAGNSAISSVTSKLLAAFWDDIDSDTGNVYWTVVGDAPNRMVVIEWNNRPHYSNVGNATFQMVLLENGSILLQYQDVVFGNATYDYGASATVGISGGTAANSLQYSYNTAALSDGLAICFAYPGTPSNCSFGADIVPWLAQSPTSGDLVADTGQAGVDITFDAAAVVQPGIYHAFVTVNSDDPFYRSQQMPVTMTVDAPATWGKLDGTVTSLGYCDVNPAPAAFETVYMESSTGLTVTLELDDNGYYSYWFDEADSPVMVYAYADEHTSASGSADITAGFTTTLNFDLRWLQPCVTVNPQSVEVEVRLDSTGTSQMTLANSGAAASGFSISTRAARNAPQALTENDVLLMTDDVVEADIQAYRDALTTAGVTYTEWNLDSNPFPSAADLDAYNVLIWADESVLTPGDSDCQVVADWLVSGDRAMFATSVDFLWDLENGTPGLGEHNLYDLFGTNYMGDYAGSAITALEGVVGDPIGGGLTLALVAGTDSNGDYSDETTSAPSSFLYGAGGTGSGRSAMTHYEGANYKTVWLGVNFHNGLTDQAERNQLMTNIMEFLLPAPLTWLTVEPITGTLDADTGSAMLNLNFDASVAEITGPGTYEGFVRVASDDPMYSMIEVPVTMNVVDFGVDLTTAANAQAGDPGQVVSYVLQLTNLGSVEDTFDLTFAGNAWSVELPQTSFTLGAGASADVTVNVTVPANAQEGDSDAVTVTATSQSAPDQSASLDLTTSTIAVYAMEMAMDTHDMSGFAGDVLTATLTISNTGNSADSYNMAMSEHAWPITLSHTSMGPVMPGQAEQVFIRVEIPASAEFGDMESITITATSEGDPEMWLETDLTISVSGVKIFMPFIVH